MLDRKGGSKFLSPSSCQAHFKWDGKAPPRTVVGPVQPKKAPFKNKMPRLAPIVVSEDEAPAAGKASSSGSGLRNSLNAEAEEAQAEVQASPDPGAEAEAQAFRAGCEAQASSDPGADAPGGADAEKETRSSVDKPPVHVPQSKCTCVVLRTLSDVSWIASCVNRLGEDLQMLAVVAGDGELSEEVVSTYSLSMGHIKIYKIDEFGSPLQDANVALRLAANHGFDWAEYVFPELSDYSFDLDVVADLFHKVNSSAVICVMPGAIATWCWLWEDRVVEGDLTRTA